MQVDISKCMSEGITISQYAFLRLLWDSKDDEAMAYLKTDSALRNSLPDLQTKGYIITYSDTKVSIDLKKGDGLFNLKPSYFWEFYSTYPLKVVSNGSVRVLRAGDPDSVNAKTAKAKYEKRVKTKEEHDHVMKCLRLELENRKRSGNLSYMQNIMTWINQSSWQLYEHLLSEDNKKSEEKYGEGLV